MSIKVRSSSGKPSFIFVCNVDNIITHYRVNTFWRHHSDQGVWHIKYKTKLDN